MPVELSTEGVERILQGVSIPPRPALLTEVDRELQAADPDLRRIASTISKDVGISAAILKTLNSPLFALRSKVGNVSQAVMLLGARNTRNVITGLALRYSLDGSGANLERFWDSAEKVASINAYLCSRLPRAPREDAYALGLFRDVGIPLLMQRFPTYRETLKIAASEERVLTDIEQLRHGTSHNAVGSIVGRSWGLPDTVCQAILNHHRPAALESGDGVSPQTRTLIAINFLAEHIIEASIRMRPDPLWERLAGPVLDFLGLSDDDYFEIEENVAALCS